MTKYIGSSTAQHRIVVYDKKSELQEKAKKTKQGQYIQPTPKRPTTRIEVRVKPKGVKLEHLYEAIGNPFSNLTISYLPPPPKGDSLVEQFSFSAKLGGANAAYSVVTDKSDKKRLVRYLKKLKVYWWRPEKLAPAIECSLLVLRKQIN